MAKTAAILIIGNEILSGKIADRNSHFLTKELRRLGVEVRRITTILDEIDTIALEVRQLSESHDWVFTSGGVGPTHDDVTMEGIAAGWGSRATHHPQLEAVLKQHYHGEELTDARRKMALTPEGAELIEAEGLFYPVVQHRNIFILPGVPEILEQKFMAIRERFRSEPFHLQRVYLREAESEIADALTSVVTDFEGVDIGSYPTWLEHEYKVLVTVESRDAELLERAMTALLERLPTGSVVRRS